MPRNFPPLAPTDDDEFGGVDACCDTVCDDPNAGAESGRAPALIGVETALAVADWPTLLLPALMAVVFTSTDFYCWTGQLLPTKMQIL